MLGGSFVIIGRNIGVCLDNYRTNIAVRIIGRYHADGIGVRFKRVGSRRMAVGAIGACKLDHLAA